MINIKTIWDNQIPAGEIIIKTRIEEISQFKCYAATNHITGNHLYIMEFSKNIRLPVFKDYKFKGLQIEVFEFENVNELDIYLLDNQLKDIFSLLIEDILDEISNCTTEKDALVETSNIVLKWKKLFDKINFQGLSLEKQRGLIGELLLFNSLIDEDYPADNLLQNWTGPDYEDKDFVFGSTGIEVKFTSSKIPKIKISSERQLDAQNLTRLYLILYSAEDVRDNGFSLNSLIEQIRLKISKKHNDLKLFNEKLLFIGYSEEDKENYQGQYAIKNSYKYLVTSDFPKIVSSALPLGIYNTTYCIELSACEPFATNLKSFMELIQ